MNVSNGKLMCPNAMEWMVTCTFVVIVINHKRAAALPNSIFNHGISVKSNELTHMSSEYMYIVHMYAICECLPLNCRCVCVLRITVNFISPKSVLCVDYDFNHSAVHLNVSHSQYHAPAIANSSKSLAVFPL